MIVNVLVIQRTLNPNSVLSEAAQLAGFGVRVIREIEEAHSLVPILENIVIFADFGTNEDEGEKLVADLSSASYFHPLPLILFGKRAQRFESTLGSLYPIATTLSLPYKAENVVGALEYIVERANYRKSTEEEHPTESAPIQEPARPPKRQQETRIVQSKSVIPKLLVEEMARKGLINREIGGKSYNSNLSLEYLQKRGYYPRDEAIGATVQEICQDAGKWGRNHLCRTNFIVTLILNSLELKTEEVELGKEAAFLFAWAFMENNPELLHKNYLRGRPVLRKEICSKIKDSAVKVATDLGKNALVGVISGMAKLLGDEEKPASEDLFILSSALVAADITDRACFHGGYWDPRAAFSLMRRIALGDLSNLHSTVISCLVKFLSERIVQKDSASFLLSKQMRRNPILLRQARALADQPVQKGEKKVEISELIPGMKLSQPLMAFDGRQLLDEDLTLDQDLIWRIWQLSAIRPINAPIIVSSDKVDPQIEN